MEDHMHVPMTFETIKKVALAIGLVGLFASATMTWKFGYAISWVHGLGFVCVTVLAAIIYPAKKFFADMNMTGAVRTFAILGPFFVAGELFGDLGYTIGQRDSSLKNAAHQTVSSTDVRDTMEDTKAQLKFFEDHLKKLDDANAWAPTITASALRAQLANAELAIKQEAERGGCKQKCLAETKKRDDLATRIATAEDRGKTVEQIAATKNKIEELRNKSADTKVGHTPVKSQSDFVGKLFLAVTGSDAKTTLNPDEYTTAFTEIFIGFFIALLATALPTVCFYIAFAGAPSRPETPADAVLRTAARNGKVEISQTLTDERGVNALKQKLLEASSSLSRYTQAA
jgi:hypothetical protein